MFIEVSWSQLSKLHSIKFINTMYIWLFIVPITAKALENVGDTAELDIFGHSFIFNLELPFSWIIFYFSTISFAAANLVFLLRCPRIVRDQKDYSEFKNSHKGIEHIDSYLPEIGMNWEGLEQNLELRDSYFDEVAQATNPKANDELLRKLFWEVFFRANKYRKNSLKLSFALYSIGITLISIVFLQNAYYVACYIYRTLVLGQ